MERLLRSVLFSANGLLDLEKWMVPHDKRTLNKTLKILSDLYMPCVSVQKGHVPETQPAETNVEVFHLV